MVHGEYKSVAPLVLNVRECENGQRWCGWETPPTKGTNVSWWGGRHTECAYYHGVGGIEECRPAGAKWWEQPVFYTHVAPLVLNVRECKKGQKWCGWETAPT